MKEDPAWYAVMVRHQHEKKAVEHLRSKGLEAFVPLSAVERQWSDRVKTVSLPIFPGYVFCRFSKQEQLLVLRSPNVTALACDQSGPIVVSDTDIDSMQKISASACEVIPCEYVECGAEICLARGALLGIRIFSVERNGVVEFIKSFHSLKRSCRLLLA